MFTALLMAGGHVIAAVAAAVEFRDAPVTDPDFVRVLPQLGYGLFLVGGAFSAIVLVLTTSVLSLQTGVFPQWLAWLGILVAIVLLLAVIFLPMIALLIWVLAVSIVLLTRREETATVAA
jgi:prepilin signal peptidase PulO-like enzyme (type II secretory pathway)